jgi:sugar phosphate isomerase/epimerase
MGKIPIALQLYSIRKDAEADLAGVLKAVAQMGYDGVEFAGYYGWSAADLKKVVADNGLKVAGAHVGLDTLLGDRLKESIDFHRAIGNQFLIVPGLGEQYRNSAAAWKNTAGIFNEISTKLRPEGMWTGYHNHHIEFTPMDGELPWDIFFGNTDKDVVMQLDSGNALHGGADIVPFLERYPGRALSVHLKEYSATNDKALIGEGDVRWDDVFDVCERAGGTQWYVVEQESYAYPPMECVERCIKTLREWGK